MMVVAVAQERRVRPTEHDLAIGAVIATMRRQPDQQLTLDQQAEIAGFSPFHFARLFRDVIGIPPGEYQTALRFERGKDLLLHTDASVTDICYEIGYESLGTFSSRFRQLVGVSPQQFRRFPAIVTADLFTERDPEVPAPLDGLASTLSGRIHLNEPGPPMSVYIGLFPAAIARGFPVAGSFVPAHDAYRIEGIPPGTYTLLAAAIPATAGPMAHLTPGSDLRVFGSNRKIVIIGHGEHHFLDVTLRKLSLCDPPILISLPALMMTPDVIRKREEALGLQHD